MKQKIIIGSRGSKLALKQTSIIAESLKKAYKELEIDIKTIKTTGDKILDVELSKIGGKGLFIKEIEEALASGEIDLAIHSLKDMPHTLPEGFEIAAITTREDPRDVLISKENIDNFIVGTSSLRRTLQIKALYPQATCKSLRGNVDTRINKLATGEYDAIILAAAGLKRLGLITQDNKISSNPELKIKYLETQDFIPSVGQGALAIEIRQGDREIF
ncbi:MAG: hydroxymethylbilane synthase [Desulfosudis oleivorans]|nr:hydroxymethylbilane synthase [Desulfosudis oleivorans]